MIKLAVFLGNPGNEYTQTRHNFGRILLDHLTKDQPFSWTGKFRGFFAQWQLNGRNIYCLKPETFMNRSGESVRPAADYYKLKTEEILVVHDDLELPFGEFKIKAGGGLGGHNGLRSIKDCLGTPDFYRLRLGIGRPNRGSVSSFVLSPFSPEEKDSLDTVIGNCLKYLLQYLQNES